MTKKRRITVKVPKCDLEGAQKFTGGGISETVLIALRYVVLEKQHPGMETDKLLQLARVPNSTLSVRR